MKRCTECGDKKDRSEFYKDSSRRDGLRGDCKICSKKSQAAYYKQNSAKVVKRAKEWQKKNPERDRQNKVNWLENNSEHRKNYERERRKLQPHRDAHTESVKIYRERYPLAHAAHWKLSEAVKAGKVDKPNKCSECGKTGMVLGHHEDYNKPLDVIWVCSKCHSRIHRDIKEQEQS